MKKIFITLQLVLITAIATIAQVDRTKAPEPGPVRQPVLGKYETFTLKNGLKVFVVEDHKLPRVSFSLILNLDPIMEGDKAGYVSMAGDMLNRGTTTRTKAQFDEEVDFMGASLNASSRNVRASGLSKYADNLVNLMADVILNPTMPEDEFNKAKEQLLSGLESNKDDAGAMMSNVWGALVYGKDHPYGEIVSEETVNNFTLDDCKAYHQTYFKPNVAYMAIVGDIKLKDAKKLVEKYFGKWQMGDVPSMKYDLPKTVSKNTVAFVDRPASVQSMIQIGNPIVLTPGDADVDALRVMNQILGGGMNGRLFLNLREDHGYTYGAYSNYGTDKLVSNFNASASVRNEVSDSAVYQFLYELDRIRTSEVTDEEFRLAKAGIAGSFGRALENPSTMASYALNTAIYGLPADYYQNYLKRLDAVTKEDIMRVAKKYIATDKLLITVVGRGQEVAPSLAQFGDLKYYDMYANPTAAPSFLTVPEGVTAEMVVDNYFKAIGGKDKISKITAAQLVYDATIEGVPYPLKITNAVKLPGSTVMIQEVPGMFSQKTGYVNGKGFNKGMQANGPIEDEKELAELKVRSNYIMTEMAYLEAGSGYTVVLDGQTKMDGKDVYQLSITSPTGDVTTELYDVASGLKRSESSSRGEGEQAMQVVTIIEDYKEFGGIMWPDSTLVNAGGQKITTKLAEVKLNKDVDSALFSE
jgi:predicted Zn-dependent peptidase